MKLRVCGKAYSKVVGSQLSLNPNVKCNLKMIKISEYKYLSVFIICIEVMGTNSLVNIFNAGLKRGDLHIQCKQSMQEERSS